ncbi:ras-related protein Rab-7L1-like [Actinia tenebrosa]|uniref:Ras-related protein Rab n=1 Tax=Actinia tenebrosa TaxID=6105 RepID=A0A6P8IAR5_ACTTE|nr:ras-related protein Rab-7L1-like [Actinia tenebrosa]
MSEVLFKVLIVGDATVGKTSFVQRYVHGNSRREYKPTIGVDFALKVIRKENTTVRLQLWDIAGQERFTSMTRVYYKGAAACVIMFDLTSQQTFNSTIRWKQDLDSKCTLPGGKNIPCILVGNKSDLTSRPVAKETIDKVCREYSFLGWTEMSVKDDNNVSETMDYLINELLQNYEAQSEDMMDHTDAGQGGFIQLSNQKKNPSEKRLCCD